MAENEKLKDGKDPNERNREGVRKEREEESEKKGGKGKFRNSRVHLLERRLKPQVYIQEKTIKNHKVLISVNTRRLGRRNRA